MNKRDFLRLLASVPVGWAGTAGAQPAGKQIRFLIPFPPGGSPDVLARKLAIELAPILGHAPLTENRPGASGIIAADAAAKAAPDGTTMVLSTGSTMAIVPQVMKKLPYDPGKDLAPVIQVGTTPFVVLVNAADPARNIQDLLARARSGQVSFGSFGNGTTTHLIGETINLAAKTRMLHVPYRGTGPAITDLIGGQVTAVITDLGTARPHLEGRLRALGVTGSRRNPAVPQIPTFGEQGLPSLDPLVSWIGFFAPGATPRPLLEKLANDIGRGLRTDTMRSEIAAVGYEPTGLALDAFGEVVRSDFVRWKNVIDALGPISLS
jgi:Uncharacterized protein conserved in bacteria